MLSHRVLLELTHENPKLQHLCFKTDGQRFTTNETTLKLARDGQYKLTFVCSPPSVIEHAEMVVSASGLA